MNSYIFSLAKNDSHIKVTYIISYHIFNLTDTFQILEQKILDKHASLDCKIMSKISVYKLVRGLFCLPIIDALW